MGQMNDKQAKQLKEIIKWAHENGNKISYLTLVDILQYEKQPIVENEELINQIIRYLSKEGITVNIWPEGFMDEWDNALLELL